MFPGAVRRSRGLRGFCGGRCLRRHLPPGPRDGYSTDDTGRDQAGDLAAGDPGIPAGSGLWRKLCRSGSAYIPPYRPMERESIKKERAAKRLRGPGGKGLYLGPDAFKVIQGYSGAVLAVLHTFIFDEDVAIKACMLDGSDDTGNIQIALGQDGAPQVAAATERNQELEQLNWLASPGSRFSGRM